MYSPISGIPLRNPHQSYLQAFAVEVSQQAQLLVEVIQVVPHSRIERRAYLLHRKHSHEQFVFNDQQAAISCGQVLTFVEYRYLAYELKLHTLLVQFDLRRAAVDVVEETGAEFIVHTMQAFVQMTDEV